MESENLDKKEVKWINLKTSSKSTMQTKISTKKKQETILHLISNELDTKTTKAKRETFWKNSDVFYVHWRKLLKNTCEGVQF